MEETSVQLNEEVEQMELVAKKQYDLDITKLKTLEDVIFILGQMGLRVADDVSNFDDLKQYVKETD